MFFFALLQSHQLFFCGDSFLCHSSFTCFLRTPAFFPVPTYLLRESLYKFCIIFFLYFSLSRKLTETAPADHFFFFILLSSLTAHFVSCSTLCHRTPLVALLFSAPLCFASDDTRRFARDCMLIGSSCCHLEQCLLVRLAPLLSCAFRSHVVLRSRTISDSSATADTDEEQVQISSLFDPSHSLALSVLLRLICIDERTNGRTDGSSEMWRRIN